MLRQGRDLLARFQAHAQDCPGCRLANGHLLGPPAPFCPTGDSLLAELAKVRTAANSAAARLRRPAAAGPAPTEPAPRSRRGPEATGRRPWQTNPRHHRQSS